MNRQLSLFCSSSNSIEPHFFDAAIALGTAIGRARDTLIYGGGNVGLMGAVATAVHMHGGRVVAVIPEALRHAGVCYEQADELIVTKDLRERKGIMDQRADAFIALPGGIGTLEEVIEIITLKQLHYHTRPIVFLDIDHFYRPLLELFDHMVERHFLTSSARELFFVTTALDEVFAHIATYVPPCVEPKWITPVAPWGKAPPEHDTPPD
ncbi:MAG: TIGR00730 family Rossman fold protein [Deltaproteobacteria bacterium]|nr:TIGR00730 family Rossman fold protein [Deltaproteobacteria bacterium]